MGMAVGKVDDACGIYISKGTYTPGVVMPIVCCSMPSHASLASVLSHGICCLAAVAQSTSQAMLQHAVSQAAPMLQHAGRHPIPFHQSPGSAAVFCRLQRYICNA
eukprot:2711297-Heterocapsa_arctica.AAC.1